MTANALYLLQTARLSRLAAKPVPWDEFLAEACRIVPDPVPIVEREFDLEGFLSLNDEGE